MRFPFFGLKHLHVTHRRLSHCLYEVLVDRSITSLSMPIGFSTTVAYGFLYSTCSASTTCAMSPSTPFALLQSIYASRAATTPTWLPTRPSLTPFTVMLPRSNHTLNASFSAL